MMYEPLQLIKKARLIINFRKQGFVLVEVFLAVALFVIMVTSFIGSYLYGQEASRESGDRVNAIMFAEGGMEAVRTIRNDDFNVFRDNSGQHGLVFSNGKWSFSGNNDTQGIFTRSVTIGAIDNDTVFATTTVTWQQNARRAGSVTLTRIFTNWLDARYWYWPGIVSSTTLSAGGDKIELQGNYAYVIGYSLPILYIVDITSSTSPVVVGSTTLVGPINDLSVSGNYAYVTSNSNTKELQVVDVSNKSSPTVAGNYNAPGNSAGVGVSVKGNIAYMTRKNSVQEQFLVLDVSNPANPSLLGSLDLGADGYGLVASGTYAYISTNANQKEFQIVDVSTPSSPTLTGSCDISQFAQSGVSSVTVHGSHAYIGQGKDLYIVNISNLAVPILKNRTSVADAFNDISSTLGNKGRYIYVATSDVNKEFKVYDVSSSTRPVIYGSSLDLLGDSPLHGVAYSTTTNIVYGVNHNASNNFFIISP